MLTVPGLGDPRPESSRKRTGLWKSGSACVVEPHRPLAEMTDDNDLSADTTCCLLLNDLPGLTFMPEANYSRATRWLTVVPIAEKEFGVSSTDVRLAIKAESMKARPVWKPMHMQPVFRQRRVRGGEVSERLFRDGLCLPS
jgi:hypothetical protein